MKNKTQPHQVSQTQDLLTRLEHNKLFLKLFDLIVFLLPLFFYILTVGKTIVSYGDSDELATAAYMLDAAHPPGYPLFVILGKIFTLLPVGTIAFRVNLLNCVLASGTVFIVSKIFRVFGIRPIIAGISTFVIAFSYSFWLYALVSEVFMLNNILAVSIVFAILLWREDRKRNTSRSDRMLFIVAFLTGLGLSNHTSILLLGPAVLYIVLKTDKRVIFRRFLYLLGSFALGLSPYLFIIYASMTPHYPNFGNLPGIDRFFQYIFRADYGGFFSAGASSGIISQNYWGLVLYFGQLLVTRYTIVAPLFALSFISQSIYKKDHNRIFLVILFLFSAIIFPLYAFKGVDADDLHVLGVAERLGQLGFVIFGVVAILGVLQSLSSIMKGKTYALLILLFSGYIGLSILLNFKNVDKNDYRLTQEYAKNILRQVEAESTIITSDDLTYFALYYFINAEHFRSDVRLINPAFLSSKWYQRELIRYWPDLYTAQTQYPYTIQRDIISIHQKKHPVYYVMLDDPYPLGFDGNPYFFTPMGLLLKADPAATKETVKAAAKTDYWSQYDLSEAKKTFKDPFQKLAKKNIVFRHEINAKVYLRAQCVDCARDEFAKAVVLDQDDIELRRKYETVSPIMEYPKINTVEGYVKSAKELIKTQGYSFNLNIHHAIWDLERALQIDPTSEEVNGILGELYEYLGSYQDSIRAYETAYKRNPGELDWQLRANTIKRKAPKRDVE